MSKFRQNGFTITEVITTLVILGIILAIAIPGVGKLQEKFRNDYYTQLDSTVLAAGKQYFKDNEDQRPVNLLEASFVDYNESSNELISKKYIDTVNQYNSADACTGHVVAVKLQDDYKYVNCMKCGGRTFYPESITTIQTQYDDNICHFSTTGDEIEKGYTIPSNFKIYINHYTQDDLKDKLCLSETVTRKDRAGNILYQIKNVEGTKKCPGNINSVKLNEEDVYTVKYDGQIVPVEVFVHPEPTLITEDGSVNIIDGIVYTKGLVNLKLDDISTFTSDYELKNFEYLDLSLNKWITEGVTTTKETFTAKINTVGWTEKNTQFRVLGYDKVSNKNQEGESINKYVITGTEINIELDKKGGTGGTSTLEHWKGFVLDKNIVPPTKTGYRFKGYFTEENGLGTQYFNEDGGVNSAISSEVIMSDKKLYAHWELIDYSKPVYYITVTDGSLNIRKKGSIIPINTPSYFNVIIEKEGTPATEVKAIFSDGTSTSCSINTSSDFFSSLSSYSSDKHSRYYCSQKSYSTAGTFVTKFEIYYYKSADEPNAKIEDSFNLKVPSYTLTYKNSNCSGTITKPYGDKWGSLCKPTAEGHVFNNWQTQSGETITNSTSVTEDVSAYPNWSYIVKYDANGGTGAPEQQIKKHNGYIFFSIEQPTRTGYSFLGWSTDKNAKTSSHIPGDIYLENEPLTLYAVWKAKTLTIRFYRNYNSSDTIYSDSSSYTYGVSNQTLADDGITFARTGYDFAGWATYANYSGNNLISATYRLTNENILENSPRLELYAVWKPKTLKINFYASGYHSTPDKSITYTYDVSNQSLEAVSNWFKNKYKDKNFTLEGWNPNKEKAKTGSVQYAVNNPVSNNYIKKHSESGIDFYAVWSGTLKYNLNGGTAAGNCNPIKAYFGETWGDRRTEGCTPTKDGYSFLGWYSQKQGSNPVPDPNFKITFKHKAQNMTVYAWYNKLVCDHYFCGEKGFNCGAGDKENDNPYSGYPSGANFVNFVIGRFDLDDDIGNTAKPWGVQWCQDHPDGMHYFKGDQYIAHTQCVYCGKRATELGLEETEGSWWCPIDTVRILKLWNNSDANKIYGCDGNALCKDSGY